MLCCVVFALRAWNRVVMAWVSCVQTIRPEIRQYLVESDTEATPFSRQHRSVVYQRAKNMVDTLPFGTRRDVYKEGCAFQ